MGISDKVYKELRRLINRLSLRLIGWLVRPVSPKGFKKLEELMVAHFERYGDAFYTHHLRPRCATQINTWSDSIQGVPFVAIVIQGALLESQDFTLETVRLYRKLHPEALVIVSTWQDANPELVEEIKALGAEVLLNEKPEYAGVKNINLQIVSSRAGVEFAKSKGASYVLKTRTDQRFYSPNVIPFLIGVLDTFPPCGDYRQSKRILGLGLNTFKYRMYGLSDMFYFGETQDMITFWEAPLDLRTEEEVPDSISVRDFAKSCFCEVYLATSYLKAIGFDLKWTLEDSFKAFSDVFAIVDKESVDLIWTKYTNREYWYLAYDAIHANQELGFREWLCLYRWRKDVVINEKSLDSKFTGKILP